MSPNTDSGSQSRGLVLDFGGPVLVTPFERLDTVREKYDLPADALDWRGPFAPDEDPLWMDMQSGRITEPAYWELRAAEFDEITGAGGLRVLMKVMYDEADSHETDLIRPSAARAVDGARAAGVKVGVLTNDLAAFHSPAWVERMTWLGQLDGLVDASVDGVRKPDAAAYVLIAQRMGVRVEDAVFVDDQPTNIEGARRAGMQAVFLEVTDPDESFRRALAALGLD